MVKKALAKKKWAVIGATNNTEKFGYKIFKKLVDRGYTVYPIHPKLEEIDGIKCYKSVFELDDTIDVVNVVVNKKLTMNIVRNKKLSAFEYVWFQPGTYDEDVINEAKKNNNSLIYDKCVLIELDAL